MAPDDTIPPLRQDVQAVVAAVAARGKSRLAIEQEARTLVDPKVYAGDAGSSPLRTPVHHQVGGYVEEEELRRTGDFYFDPLLRWTCATLTSEACGCGGAVTWPARGSTARICRMRISRR